VRKSSCVGNSKNNAECVDIKQNETQIRELIQMRDHGHEILAGEEINEIIALLCTSFLIIIVIAW
jgi:hypothetical protein